MIAAAVEAAMSGDGAITAQEVPPLQPVFGTPAAHESPHGVMGRVIRCKLGCQGMQ